MLASRGNALGAGPVLGDAVIETNVGVRSGIGGYIDTAPEIGAELVPLLFGSAAPSGTIADEAYEYMRDELLSRLRDAMPVDAVALALHGAGAAESYEDIEGDLGRRVREVIGPDVPLVATWDLHGNISQECAATYDFMCCYHTYPHVKSPQPPTHTTTLRRPQCGWNCTRRWTATSARRRRCGCCRGCSPASDPWCTSSGCRRCCR